MLDVIAIVGNDRFELKDKTDVAILLLELAKKDSPSFRINIEGSVFRATYLQTMGYSSS